MESMLLLFVLFMLVLECNWYQSTDREEDEARYNERRFHDAKSRRCNLTSPHYNRTRYRK